MKLGDIFGKLGNLELVSLLRWYGLCVLGVFAVVLALSTLYIVYGMVMLISTALPWYGWVIVGIVASGFLAVHFTEPDRGFDEDMRILHAQLYRNDED